MKNRQTTPWVKNSLAVTLLSFRISVAWGQEYFDALVQRLQKEKPRFAERHKALLQERYDLGDRRAAGVTMSRGKPVQEGVRVKLPTGETWDSLSAMPPDQIKSKGVWPAGLSPLPHPHHEAG